jgi:hypothetical protein
MSGTQTVKIPQHNTPQGTWCRFSGCDSKSGICRMCEPDPACWADPLTGVERRELARRLGRACKAAYDSATIIGGRRATSRQVIHAAICTSADMADLHLDVTERAAVADR